MNHYFKRIISLICSLAIVAFSFLTPAFAAGGIVGNVVDGAQTFFEWNVNTGNNFANSFFRMIFGDDFNNKTDEEFREAYDDYVSTLPATGYNSAGRLIWQPTIDDIPSIYYSSLYGGIFDTTKLPWGDSSESFSLASNGVFWTCNVVSEMTFMYYVKAPLSGTYRALPEPCIFVRFFINNSVVEQIFPHYDSGAFFHYNADSSIAFGLVYKQATPAGVNSFTAFCPFPVFEVIPDTAPSVDTYNITTRPTSITGGNYGIIGDNGQITKVENNSTIVNETNNTYFNPVTGQTVPITGWSYDYSDRSYTLTLEGDKTSTVTYGDESISIVETTITESGDTITNNYTIYYLIDGTGETPVDPSAACTHNWQETSTTPATCTLPGSRLLTCSLCSQTKTEAIPALGHDWQVKQSVTTEYDDTGQLVQQGYTIFQCSRCQEQYKSTDGTIPPGGGSGTDPGGEDGETLWDKIGKLLGTIVNGILSILGSFIDTILGGLIDLATNLFESLKQLVDIFGAVGEAFGILWTWLPPEIMAILITGVTIFVFIALLKFFMK